MSDTVEYYLWCFDRTLTITFAEPVDVDEVKKLMDGYYEDWHHADMPMTPDGHFVECLDEYIITCLDDYGYDIIKWRSDYE